MHSTQGRKHSIYLIRRVFIELLRTKNDKFASLKSCSIKEVLQNTF